MLIFFQDFSFTLPLVDKIVFRNVAFEEHCAVMLAVLAVVWFVYLAVPFVPQRVSHFAAAPVVLLAADGKQGTCQSIVRRYRCSAGSF